MCQQPVRGGRLPGAEGCWAGSCLLAEVGGRSSSFRQGRESRAGVSAGGVSARAPWGLARLTLPVLPSVRLSRAAGCDPQLSAAVPSVPCRRALGFEPPASASPVGHRTVRLPPAAAGPACFPGRSGWGQRRRTGWESSPQSLSPHLLEPHPQPGGQSGAEAPQCSPGALGRLLVQSERWSLHVRGGFVSIPRGAAGAVLAPCHASGCSSVQRGVSVHPVVVLMSPEI